MEKLSGVSVVSFLPHPCLVPRINQLANSLLFFFSFIAKARYACPNCFRTYKRKVHLRRHLNLECGKEPKFACQFCPYKAKQKCTLKSHVALKHAQILN